MLCTIGVTTTVAIATTTLNAENTSLYTASRMYIGKNTPVYISGDLVHNGAKGDDFNIFNAGSIYVKRNILNYRGNIFKGSSNSETNNGIISQGMVYFAGNKAAISSEKYDTVYMSSIDLKSTLTLYTDVHVQGNVSLYNSIDLNGNNIFLFYKNNANDLRNTGQILNEDESFRVTGKGAVYAVKRYDQWNELTPLGFFADNENGGSIYLSRYNTVDSTLLEDMMSGYFKVRTTSDNTTPVPQELLLRCFPDQAENISGEKAVTRIYPFDENNPATIRYNSVETANGAKTDEAVFTQDTFAVFTLASATCINPPKISLGEDTNLCIGKSADITVQIAGEKSRKHYCYLNGDYYWDGILKDEISFYVNKAGQYIFKVIDEKGCTGVDTINVSIHPYPEPLLSANTDLLCENEVLQLIYTDTVPCANILWDFGDSTNASDVDTVFKTFPVGCESYTITLNAETEYGCAASTSISVRTEVTPQAKISINFLTDTVADISAIIEGACNDMLSYKWFIDSVPVSIQKQFRYIFPERREYSLTLEVNTLKCSAAADTLFEIKERALMSFTPNKKHFCAGDTITLHNTTQINYGDFVFYWKFSDGKSFTTYSAADSVSRRITEAGMYIVSLSGVSEGWARTVQDTFWVHQNPAPSLPDSIFTCYNYYVLQVNNVFEDEYVWTNENNIYVGGYSAYNVRKNGKYTVTQTSSYGCVGTDNVVVILNERIKVRLGDNRIACDSITLDAGYLSEKCIWNYVDTSRFFTVRESGKIVLRVEADSGCYGIDSVYVSIFKKPNTFLGVDTFFCSGDSILLQLPANEQGCNIRWTGGDYKGGWVTQRGTYGVIITDSSGYCADSSSVFIEERQSPILDIPDITFACNGDTVQLEMWNNASAEKIIWTLPNGEFAYGPVLWADEEGRYKVTVTYSNTCSASGIWDVRERSTNAISSFLMASMAMAGDSVFLISLSHPLPLSHKWESTSGFRSEMENPVTQFYRNGFYAMTLNVSNNECATGKTKFIQIGNVIAMKQDSSEIIMEEDKIIEENPNNSNDIVCKVIPNPSKNIFSIVFDDDTKTEYSVTNALGRKICSGKAVNGRITLNAENWRAGIYLLFVRTDSHSKVIKLMKI
jgi:hypothetical protein